MLRIVAVYMNMNMSTTRIEYVVLGVAGILAAVTAAFLVNVIDWKPIPVEYHVTLHVFIGIGLFSVLIVLYFTLLWAAYEVNQQARFARENV